METDLQELKNELAIAEKFNFEKEEIENIKRLIQNEENKNASTGKQKFRFFRTTKTK